jgi:hypothetical protein
MTQPNEDEDFFESATSEFPAKEDLKDRLVAIWNTGKTGTRKSEATGLPYPYVETITVVLDDGPNGWQDRRPEGAPNLVPSVAEHGPQRLDGFQWSATGVYSRAVKRPVGSIPMIGRINMKPNKTKGMSPPWNIDEMTDADREIAREHRALLITVTNEIRNGAQKAEDDAAFA